MCDPQFKKQQWKMGMHDGIPVFLGYLAVSFAFGIQSARGGLTPFQAALMSACNLTSAGQFSGLSSILSGGGYAEIALLQLIINARYFLMSVAMSQKFPENIKLRERLLVAYGVTDEIFGLSVTKKGPLYPSYSYGLTLTSALGWVSGTALGACAGFLLPDRLIRAFGIALYGMFLAIILPPARSDRRVLAAVVMASTASVVLTFLPFFSFISSGMRIILITVILSAVCAVLFPAAPEEEEETV